MKLPKPTSSSSNKASRPVVGLDIEPSHLAAAEVSVNGRVRVERGVVSMLAPGVLRDGEVTDADALTDALRGMWDEHKLPKTVRIGVAHQRIVVRTLDLPPLEDHAAVASAVRFQAPDHIPMPMDEAVMDFQSLGLVDTPGGKRARVVVVAARKDMVARLVDAARSAGLKVAGVDLAAFAMLRSLDTHPGASLYVNVAGLTNIAVAEGDHCLFARAASGGLEQIVTQLAERRSLTPEHARMWLSHTGVTAPLEHVAGDPEIVGAARSVLADGLHHLADTVRNSLNFYRMQEGSIDVERAVLTGPALAIPGFADELSRQINLPVHAGTPAGAAQAGEAESGRLTVAAGLAVEQRPVEA